MENNTQTICWPAARLGEAFLCLAQRAGLRPKATETPSQPTWIMHSGRELFDAWLGATAGWLDIEIDSVETTYAEVLPFLKNSGPAVIRLDFETGPSFLAVVKCRQGTLHVVSPDLRIERIPARVIASHLCGEMEAPIVEEVDDLLDRSGIVGKRALARSSILSERLANVPIQGCWLLRLPPGRPFSEQLRRAGLVRNATLFVASHAVESLLMVAAWWMIGHAVLRGWFDYGWLIAWALVLVTRIPFRLMGSWIQGRMALTVGSLLKRRLLAGSLRIPSEQIRHEGAGLLLGRVIESEALEVLAMGGGLAGLMAIIEALIAALVLGFGAGNVVLALLLPLWMAGLTVLVWQYTARKRESTEKRLRITNALLERMVGHRTRIIQQGGDQRHEQEDESLVDYLECCGRMDRALVRFVTIVPRSWLILGIAVLLPGFVSGDISTTVLAVSLGGILLAQGALKSLAESLAYFAGALVAWNQVRPLFEAAAREEVHPSPDCAVFAPRNAPPAQEAQEASEAKEALVEAEGLVFQHAGRTDRVLDGCSVRVCAGDRILLEGPSGGGKSTLVSLLAGLRQSQSGLLMLHGLDRKTLGDNSWRRSIAAAPQFHENHILTGTLAFNLLMGREWPPEPEDQEEAEMVCRELGLGPLLDRMPAGLSQTVGETGWQLSHGERSRVFLARALLQKSEFVILDESFGALDPLSLQQAMQCVQERAKTVMVIAHP